MFKILELFQINKTNFVKKESCDDFIYDHDVFISDYCSI